MRDIKDDLKFGKNAEKEVKPILEDVFGKLNETDSFNNFDFSNDNYYVEHKQRNIPFGQYDSLYFDKVKYNRYIELKKENAQLRCFIVWSCLNGRYVWEFKDQFNGNDACFYTYTQKNQDRGKGYLQNTEMVNVFNEYIIKLEDFKL